MIRTPKPLLIALLLCTAFGLVVAAEELPSNLGCGADSQEPCDDNGHGTHTLGIVLGDDGGSNQIGMAPQARWIGCRNMNAGQGTPASEGCSWDTLQAAVDAQQAAASLRSRPQ